MIGSPKELLSTLMTLLSGSLGAGTGSAGVGVGTAIASGGGGSAFAHTTVQYSGSIEVKEDEDVCEVVLGGRTASSSNESTFLSSKPPKLILQGNESRNL